MFPMFTSAWAKALPGIETTLKHLDVLGLLARCYNFVVVAIAINVRLTFMPRVPTRCKMARSLYESHFWI